MAAQSHTGHFFVADLHFRSVERPVEFRFDAEACLGGCGSDEVDDGSVAGERFTRPVHADEREHSVFDLIPFARSRRVVAHGDAHSQIVGELLEVILPCPGAAAVASPPTARS